MLQSLLVARSVEQWPCWVDPQLGRDSTQATDGDQQYFGRQQVLQCVREKHVVLHSGRGSQGGAAGQGRSARGRSGLVRGGSLDGSDQGNGGSCRDHLFCLRQTELRHLAQVDHLSL